MAPDKVWAFIQRHEQLGHEVVMVVKQGNQGGFCTKCSLGASFPISLHNRKDLPYVFIEWEIEQWRAKAVKKKKPLVLNGVWTASAGKWDENAV